MVSSTLTTLLTLSTLSLAVPHSNKHFNLHFPQGSGVGRPSGFPARPSAGFPFNGTENGPFGNSTGAGSESLPVVTATVVPIPEDTPVADASKPDVNQGNAAPSPVADASAPAAGGAGDACTTVTNTATSVQYVTVTAGTEEEKPSVPVAGFDAPGSSATIVSEAPSVSAGAFFGIPTYGDQPAASPTTAATSYGGGESVPVSSIVSSVAGSLPSTVPSTGGSKKGLAYNSAPLLAPFEGSDAVWAYNWADSPGGTIPTGIEFVPMCWDEKSGPTFAQNAAGASHVLSFNEPDHKEQANMDPATAAAAHITFLNPLAGSSEIISPAITNGAGTSPLMGIDWLNAFFDKCAGQCIIDAVAFHWYDSNKNIEYFKKHVQDVIDTAAQHGISRVWLTEYGTTDGDSAEFVTESKAFLDSTPAVERYSYFMVDSILVNGNSLTAAGQAYAD